MNDKIRVLLADDHTIVREGLRSLLESARHISVVGDAEDGASAVALAKDLDPDVVITDLAMPGLDGIEATRQIRKQLPRVQVIILSMYKAEAYVREAFAAGASGYVVKNTDLKGLIAAVEAVVRNEMHLSPSVSRQVIQSYVKATAGNGEGDGYQELTDREREVFKKIALGWTNREVARQFNISEKTVAAHRGNIMRKLKLNNLSHLVRFAIRKGLIEVDQPETDRQ